MLMRNVVTLFKLDSDIRRSSSYNLNMQNMLHNLFESKNESMGIILYSATNNYLKTPL